MDQYLHRFLMHILGLNSFGSEPGDEGNYRSFNALADLKSRMSRGGRDAFSLPFNHEPLPHNSLGLWGGINFDEPRLWGGLFG